MADIVDPVKRSEMMAGIGAKDTKPEILVRRILHRLGFRFRLHRKDLPGKPDIVLPKWNTVVFVHGCFWHGHADCPLYRPPKTKQDFWLAKISSNQTRDRRNLYALTALGWHVVTVWECATKGPQKLVENAFETALTAAIRSNLEHVDIRGI